MKNMNKKSIVFGLKILSILVFSLIFVPFNRVAAAPTYVYGHDNADGTYTFGDFVWNNNSTSTNGIDNPVPAVTSINPKSENVNINVTTITITGSGFIPSSVARINGSNRPGTFIDSSHLLVQINSNDVNTYETNGGFYITVFNGAPGGGYSNAAFFGVNNAASATNGTDNNSKNYGSLASNAIFGSNSFLPSGLIQWVLFAIIILIIVIIVRKIFGGKEHYDELPMKHA